MIKSVLLSLIFLTTYERYFGTLRYLKITWETASSKSERLNVVALLNVHQDVNILVDDVLNEFGKKKKFLFRNAGANIVEKSKYNMKVV